MTVSKAGMPLSRRIQLCAVAFLIAILIAPPLCTLAADSDLSASGAHGMVVSESEDAARAGVEILKQGGNAVDAAVATALAVGVTNPASCGIGGGGFMLIYIAKTHKVYALDYREKAPRVVTASTYMRDGKPDENLLRNGPLAVAVP